MDNLNAPMVARLRIPVPPLQEQIAIIDRIVRESSLVDAALSRANLEIELLREYRTRLIADVVTGKLDVRAAAAQLPAEPDESEDVLPEEDPLDAAATDQAEAEEVEA